jgi:hypothetical protein
MRELKRRLDRLEGSGGGDGMFILPLPDRDTSGYSPEQLTTVEIIDPNAEGYRTRTVPGLIVCPSRDVPMLMRSIEGRSRIAPDGGG